MVLYQSELIWAAIEMERAERPRRPLWMMPANWRMPRSPMLLQLVEQTVLEIPSISGHKRHRRLGHRQHADYDDRHVQGVTRHGGNSSLSPALLAGSRATVLNS